jgi:hypothetical protein
MIIEAMIGPIVMVKQTIIDRLLTFSASSAVSNFFDVANTNKSAPSGIKM